MATTSASPFALALLAAAIGGVAGGVVTHLASSSPAVELTDDSSELLALRDKVSRLNHDNEALSGRLRALELFTITPSADRSVTQDSLSPVMTDPEFVADLASEVAELSAAIGSGNQAPEAFVATVAEALEAIREQEDLERDERRAERRVEQIDEYVAALTETLALDPYQQGQMKKVLIDAAAKREDIRDMGRATGDWGSIRESFEDLRTETDEAFATFLMPHQLELMQDSDLYGGSPWDDRRRGGGGGGGGDGPGEGN